MRPSRHRLMQRRSGWMVAAALLLMLVLPSDALALSWAGDRQLTGGGSGWASPGGLAVSSSTLVHAVFEKQVLDSWGVYHRRSTNSGSSWSVPILLSREDVGAAVAPSIEAYGQSLNAIWIEGDSPLSGTDSVIVHRRSADGGLTWSAPEQLSPLFESAGYPRIARSGSRVAVTWTNQLNGRIYLRRSADGGMTWSARQLLATTTSEPFGGNLEAYPAPAYGSGVLVVAYYGATGKLQVRRSIDSGATWKSPQTLATNGWSRVPSVAASGSTIVVGYSAKASSDYWTMIRRSTDKGATWKTAVSLNPKSSYKSWAPVVVVRGSRWMAVYEKCTSSGCGTRYAYYRASTNSGRTWSSATKVSVKKRAWAYPVDVDVATKTLVLYNDYNNSAQDAWVRQGS